MGAKQVGFLNLSKGSLGDTTFSKTKNGFTAKPKKRELSNRKTSSKYALSNQNAEEFGNSSAFAKLIRKSVDELTVVPEDTKMMQKLTSCMSKIILMDKEGSRGKRMPTPENLKLLTGFNMNTNVSLKLIFNSRFRTNANRVKGEYGINIPSFIPTVAIMMPKTATHFRIVSAASAIDFSGKKYQRVYAHSEMIALNDTPTGDIGLVHQLSANTPNPVFMFLGLEFLQVYSSATIAVSIKKKDPLGIVNVIID